MSFHLLKPVCLVLILATFALSGCGMGKKRYEEARSNPVSEIPLTATCSSVQKVGDSYRYCFSFRNAGQQGFAGSVDIDLLTESLGKHITDTRLGFAVPAGQTLSYCFETPVAPASADPEGGYRYFVFRAYDTSDHVLARAVGDVPALANS